MSLDNALQAAVSKIPECVAAGYVDLTTGMLLGIRTLDSHPAEVIDLVSVATADIFQGSNVTSIETLFKKARGLKDDDHHYFQEAIFISDNLFHIFMRSHTNEEQVLGIVCRKTANLGLVLTKTRRIMPEIRDAAWQAIN